jgi:hypothetical protein
MHEDADGAAYAADFPAAVVDTSTWDDAMFLRSEALLRYELEQEDPDTYPSGPNYER